MWVFVRVRVIVFVRVWVRLSLVGVPLDVGLGL